MALQYHSRLKDMVNTNKKVHIPRASNNQQDKSLNVNGKLVYWFYNCISLFIISDTRKLRSDTPYGSDYEID